MARRLQCLWRTRVSRNVFLDVIVKEKRDRAARTIQRNIRCRAARLENAARLRLRRTRLEIFRPMSQIQTLLFPERVIIEHFLQRYGSMLTYQTKYLLFGKERRRLGRRRGRGFRVSLPPEQIHPGRRNFRHTRKHIFQALGFPFGQITFTFQTKGCANLHFFL